MHKKITDISQYIYETFSSGIKENTAIQMAVNAYFQKSEYLPGEIWRLIIGYVQVCFLVFSPQNRHLFYWLLQ